MAPLKPFRPTNDPEQNRLQRQVEASRRLLPTGAGVGGGMTDTGLLPVVSPGGPATVSVTLSADANPLAIGGADVVRLDAATHTVRAMDSANEGKRVHLWNVGASNFTISVGDGTAPAHLKILACHSGANLTVGPGALVVLNWSAVDDAWRAALVGPGC